MLLPDLISEALRRKSEKGRFAQAYRVQQALIMYLRRVALKNTPNGSWGIVQVQPTANWSEFLEYPLRQLGDCSDPASGWQRSELGWT
jgi:hypothetical protein